MSENLDTNKKERLSKSQKNKNYIDKLKMTGKLDDLKKKRAEYMRIYRARVKNQEHGLPTATLEAIIGSRREARRERTRKYREKQKHQNTGEDAAESYNCIGTQSSNNILNMFCEMCSAPINGQQLRRNHEMLLNPDVFNRDESQLNWICEPCQSTLNERGNSHVKSEFEVQYIKCESTDSEYDNGISSEPPAMDYREQKIEIDGELGYSISSASAMDYQNSKTESNFYAINQATSSQRSVTRYDSEMLPNTETIKEEISDYETQLQNEIMQKSLYTNSSSISQQPVSDQSNGFEILYIKSEPSDFGNVTSSAMNFQDPNKDLSDTKQSNIPQHSGYKYQSDAVPIAVKEEISYSDYYLSQPLLATNATETENCPTVANEPFLDECTNFGNQTKFASFNAAALFCQKSIFSFKKAFRKQGKSFICKLCFKSKKFFHLTSIKHHIKIKHFDSRYQCSECNEYVINSKLLREHYKRQHNSRGPDKLKPVMFLNPRKNSRETAKNDSIKKSRKNNYQKVNNHYYCNLCQHENLKGYTSITGVQHHIRVNHYCHRYLCPECKRNYKCKKSLSKHYAKQHQDRTVPKYLRLEHKLPTQIYHFFLGKYKKVDSQFLCKICPQPFKYSTNAGVLRHLQFFHYGFRYECTDCLAKFTTRIGIKNHYKLKHGKNVSTMLKPKRNYKLIKKNYDKSSSFVLAESIKKIDNHYQCTLCKGDEMKKYTTLNGVQIHIRLHHYGYRYLCTECKMGYKDLKSVRNHLIKAHNKDVEGLQIKLQLPSKKSEYIEPPKRLTYENDYTEIDNSFFCTTCSNPKKYGTKRKVQDHIKLDHYGYRYICTECDTAYRTTQALRRHHKRKHKIDNGLIVMKIPTN